LRLKPAPPIAATVAAPAEGNDILVIDDGATSREVIAFNLATIGFRATLAATAEAALAEVEGKRWAAMLIDFRLPGRDGISLLGDLKARLQAGNRPRVVIISGDPPQSADLLAAAGVGAWLIKPVSRDDLAAALAGLEAPERREGGAP